MQAGTRPMTELVAEEIRAWMGRRQMSGARLARTLGVSQMWVSYRLNGRQPIDINDLDAIARALDVSVVDLLPASTVAASSVRTGVRVLRTVGAEPTREYRTTAGRAQCVPRRTIAAPGGVSAAQPFVLAHSDISVTERRPVRMSPPSDRLAA